MAKRKGLSKRTRFEVFKRDSFTCQYCGGVAPTVVLVVDHVNPVATGGTDDLMNLVTSCVACNAGKSDVPLSDSAALAKRHAQAAALQERREQIEMMAQWQASLVEADTLATDVAVDLFARVAPGRIASATGRAILHKLVRKYGLEMVCASMREAADQIVADVHGVATPESSAKMFEVLPKYLATRKLCAEKPWMRDAFFIRAIARRRCGYFVDWQALRLIEDALLGGAPADYLQSIARDASSWSQWREEMEILVARKERG